MSGKALPDGRLKLALDKLAAKGNKIEKDEVITKEKLLRMQELHDVEKIRKVTKGVYKELNPFVDDSSGRVPVFGFPLICYSPRGNGESGIVVESLDFSHLSKA